MLDLPESHRIVSRRVRRASSVRGCYPRGMDDAHRRGLERAYLAAPCNADHAATIEVGDGTARIVLSIGARHFHGGGALHGSVVFKALDDAAFFAANAKLAHELVLTQSFTVTFLRPVRGERIESEGRVVHRSRRLLVAEAVARDERGRDVARGSGTFLPGGIALADVTGYIG